MRPIKARLKKSLWRVTVVGEIHIYYHIWRYLLKVIKWGFQSVGIHIQNDNFVQCTTPHLLSDMKKRQLGYLWPQTACFMLKIVVLPQIKWCEPQLSKAWVRWNHTNVLTINKTYSHHGSKEIERYFTSSSPTDAVAVQGWRCVANTWGIIRHSVRARTMLAANGDRFRQLLWPLCIIFPISFHFRGFCMKAADRLLTVLSLLAKMRMRLSNSILA